MFRVYELQEKFNGQKWESTLKVKGEFPGFGPMMSCVRDRAEVYTGKGFAVDFVGKGNGAWGTREDGRGEFSVTVFGLEVCEGTVLDYAGFPVPSECEESAIIDLITFPSMVSLFTHRTPAKQVDDKHECRMCLGTGQYKRNGIVQGNCINCNGTGLEPRKKSYHAAMPEINLSGKTVDVPSPVSSPVAQTPAPSYVAVRPGTYTVVMGEEYVTLRVKVCDSGSLEGKTIISYLSGSDNERDYTGFGFVQDSGKVSLWNKFKGNTKLQEAVNIFTSDPDTAGEKYAMESGRCYRCNRKLTVPASLHRGLGPDCAEMYA